MSSAAGARPEPTPLVGAVHRSADRACPRSRVHVRHPVPSRLFDAIGLAVRRRDLAGHDRAPERTDPRLQVQVPLGAVLGPIRSAPARAHPRAAPRLDHRRAARRYGDARRHRVRRSGASARLDGRVLGRLWSAPRFAETSFKADMIRRRVMMMTTETAASGGVGLGRGGRMSRKRKRDAVLRLLRGEDLETLSRALGATAATLTGWQDTFVAAGEARLATRSTDGEALETERLKAKLGEMLLERELLDAKIAALEANRPLARRRSRR